MSSPCKHRWTQYERRGSAMVAVATPYSLRENAMETITLNTHAVQAPKTRRDDAVETQWHLHGLLRYPCKCRRQHRRSRGVHGARLRRSCGVVGDLTALLRRLYGVPTARISQRRATARTLSMFKVRAVAWRPRRPHGVQWRCHGAPTAL